MAAPSNTTTGPEMAEEQPYTPNKPWVKLHVEEGQYFSSTYTPLHVNRVDFDPAFGIPHGVDATPEALCELFLPESTISRIVTSTQAYANNKVTLRNHYPVDKPSILRLLASIMYMGLVRLPSKRDYFRVDGLDDQAIWPHHATIKLARNHFDFLWSCFHLMEQQEPDNDADFDNDDIEEEDVLGEPLDYADAAGLPLESPVEPEEVDDNNGIEEVEERRWFGTALM